METPGFQKKLRNFAKEVGQSIHKFKMIEDKDKIVIGVSGGKDSMSLCVALQERKKWLQIDYDLLAMQVDWDEFPLNSQQKEKNCEFFAKWNIPYKIVKSKMFESGDNQGFNCYICSRIKKKALFTEAAKAGYTKIAFGHHKDDVVETILLNMLYTGEFSSMKPVQSFFNDTVKVIRPMYEVPESSIIRISKLLEVPVFSIDCPFKETSKRAYVKGLLKQLQHVNKNAKKNIYRSQWHINKEYLPIPLN